jgi:protein-disulfide isomerase
MNARGRSDDPVDHSALTVSDLDHADGPANAPAMLLVYGDYECPYTRAAHVAIRRVQPRLAGLVRYVYRHFPLRAIHPHAQHAAEMSEVANAAGKFWPMHDHLFRHQGALEDADLVRYATDVGIDAARARDALVSHAHVGRVDADVRSALDLGVRGTPTLFINGVRYTGDRGVPALELALRESTDRRTA